MMNETYKQVLSSAEAHEFILYRGPELTNVGCRIVCEPGKLRVIPHAFVRVQLRGIRRQPVRPQFRVARQEVTNQPRVVVDIDPVPDDVQWPPDLPAQEAKERNDVLGSGVLVVLQEAEVKAQSVSPGTHCDRAYGGDPVVAIPALLHGRLPARCERSTHQGGEHEA